MTDEIIRCPECKYYYAPVCTFHRWLPMVSRRGFCYHAVRGRYEGDVPTIERKEDTGKQHRTVLMAMVGNGGEE